jgi:regulator of cell morphogenesis and NO signaling
MAAALARQLRMRQATTLREEAVMSSATDGFDVLDCRRLTPQTYGEVVLDQFDSLAPAQRFRLDSAEPPLVALETLERERRGAFEWSPVREGPTSWQVDVVRRAAPVGAMREVTEALVWDHARLDALEAAAFEARARGDLRGARAIFSDFAHGLRRHIDFEEQILFPEFEARCRLEGDPGPLAVMRDEHRAVQSLLLIMEREIDDPRAPIEFSRTELRQIQRDHDLKEEQIFYPALDRLLDEEEGDRVVKQIQTWTRP